MEGKQVWVRHFKRSDVSQLLILMKKLAEFESYIDHFVVTEADIIGRGLCKKPQFYALVAGREGSESLAGMAVLYIIPYTYTLKPSMVLKELYVKESARGFQLGSTLFEEAKKFASSNKCGQLIWTVMKGNEKAEQFYVSHKSKPDEKWKNWFYKLE